MVEKKNQNQTLTLKIEFQLAWTDFEVTKRVRWSAIGDRNGKMLPKTKLTLHANKWLLTTLKERTTWEYPVINTDRLQNSMWWTSIFVVKDCLRSRVYLLTQLIWKCGLRCLPTKRAFHHFQTILIAPIVSPLSLNRCKWNFKTPVGEFINSDLKRPKLAVSFCNLIPR